MNMSFLLQRPGEKKSGWRKIGERKFPKLSKRYAFIFDIILGIINIILSLYFCVVKLMHAENCLQVLICLCFCSCFSMTLFFAGQS